MSTSSSPGPTNRWGAASKGARTRRLIVGAARQEFSARGYAGTTFQQIGDRLGLTRPAVRRHFASKQALYCEVVQQTEMAVAQAAALRGRQDSATLLEELLALSRIVIATDSEEGSSNMASIASSVVEAHRHPELGGFGRGVVIETRAYLGAVLHRAVERGELAADTDIAPLTAMLTALVCGMGCYAGLTTTRPEDVDAVVDLARRLLAGSLWQVHPGPQPCD